MLIISPHSAAQQASVVDKAQLTTALYASGDSDEALAIFVQRHGVHHYQIQNSPWAMTDIDMCRDADGLSVSRR